MEMLVTLHAQGIRLGVVTNGAVQRQQPKIAQLQIHPYLSTIVSSWQDVHGVLAALRGVAR